MIWKACKTFQKTPEELNKAFNYDDFLWNWTLSNINEDQSEDWKMVRDIFEALKPWLNIELWKYNKPQQPTKFSSTFTEELKKKGASIKELEDIISRERTEGSSEEEEDKNAGIQLIEG